MKTRICFTLSVIWTFLILACCRGYDGLPEGETPDPKPRDVAAWETLNEPSGALFGDVDTRYPYSQAPDIASLTGEWNATAWRGEKIHTQVVVWSDKQQQRVNASIKGDLRCDADGVIPASKVSVGLLRYVLTDSLNRNGSGYRLPPFSERDSSIVADAIEPLTRCSMEEMTVRPFWVSIDVPRDAAPGLYRGTIAVKMGSENHKLPFTVAVKEHQLPPPAEWKFYLNLWQNPFSISRYHGVEPWSEEHLSLMRPYMEMLAAAGQKNITVSMIHDPWRGQTYDIYQSMIGWTKLSDGTWQYDYTIFDRWVELMDEAGINGLISCYSMIPWNNRFSYHDQALAQDTIIEAEAGSPEYVAHWKPMLVDFARHLRERGWFERTAIAMDERPEKKMNGAIAVVRSVDPDFKISLAGSYHDANQAEIYDYCIALGEDYPEDVLRERIAAGLPTTFYTCCVEGHPNTFTCSPPSEAAWMAWHAAAMGYHGYLRWAYNCWPADPLHDSRFSKWSGGDTYLVYPGPRSSIRFERLIEGIQDFEKIRILEPSLTTEECAQLRAVLNPFRDKSPENIRAAEDIRAARNILNNL